MSMIEIFAMAPPPPPGTEANPTGQLLNSVGMIVLLCIMFYFLLIRPQSKQRKEQEKLIKGVKSGDRILTTGGLYGIVTNVKDKTVMVKIADNVKVELIKSAISTVEPKVIESELVPAGN